MLYVGIDPGERWCGVAFLELSIQRKVIRGDARTFDISAHGGYAHAVSDIVGSFVSQLGALVLLENFHVRPLGHQTFTQGLTLRMIGAFEYAVAQQGHALELVPAGNPSEVAQMFGAPFTEWRARWPRPKVEQWAHALSAWRVIGRHLLTHDLLSLQEFRNARLTDPGKRWMTCLNRQDQDLVAPTALWEMT